MFHPDGRGFSVHASSSSMLVSALSALVFILFVLICMYMENDMRSFLLENL